MDHIDAEPGASSFAARDLARMVRTHWKGMVLITVLVTLLALLWSLIQPKVYSSTATGVVVATGALDLPSALVADDLELSKAHSYESLATSRPVAQTVIDALGLDVVPDSLLERIATEVPVDTAEIWITAEAGEPAMAAELANAWIVALGDQVEEMESAVANDSVVHSLSVRPLSNATLPREPSSPNLAFNVALGVIGGVVAAFFYAYVRYRMDRRVRSVDEIRDALGLTVLGIVPREVRLAGRRMIFEGELLHGREHHPFSEAIRELRTNLGFGWAEGGVRAVVVTSPLPGDGKSVITANLAVAFASAGHDVIVVDGDLRSPVMTTIFGLAPNAGLTEVLRQESELGDVLQRHDSLPNLQVLGAGGGTPNPAELLSSNRLRELLRMLAEDAIVLVDSPPLLSATDAALLTAVTDATIIVATPDKTTRGELTESVTKLETVHGTVLGVVLNRVPTKGPEAGYYGYFHSRNYSRSE